MIHSGKNFTSARQYDSDQDSSSNNVHDDALIQRAKHLTCALQAMFMSACSVAEVSPKTAPVGIENAEDVDRGVKEAVGVETSSEAGPSGDTVGLDVHMNVVSEMPVDLGEINITYMYKYMTLTLVDLGENDCV